MLEQSMLAKDRRRESFLLIILSIIFFVQLSLRFFVPFHHLNVLYFNMLLGAVCVVGLIVCCAVRLYCLRSLRPFSFQLGMLFWVVLAAASLLASAFLSFLILETTLRIPATEAFLSLVCIYSLLARRMNWQFFREIGWPVLKSIHVLLAVVIIGLSAGDILLWDQLFAGGGALLLLGFRYGYNRWIYAPGVHYPFKKTAPKFYINKMRSTS